VTDVKKTILVLAGYAALMYLGSTPALWRWARAPKVAEVQVPSSALAGFPITLGGDITGPAIPALTVSATGIITAGTYGAAETSHEAARWRCLCDTSVVDAKVGTYWDDQKMFSGMVYGKPTNLRCEAQ
jgi:hypothetical protein